jgi:hypothetical protein
MSVSRYVGGYVPFSRTSKFNKQANKQTSYTSVMENTMVGSVESLYEDLETTGLEEHLNRLKDEVRMRKVSQDALRGELSEQTAMNEHLANDKRVLEVNIATIFNTACRESQRKDRDIEELRLANMSLKEENKRLREEVKALSRS